VSLFGRSVVSSSNGLDPKVFVELRKLEDQNYRKGYREGFFWGMLLGSAITVLVAVLS
jgi:hypothetical protein